VNERVPGAQASAGWDCHVHVFDDSAPARAGHYRPVARPLADIEALAAAHGVQHLVLVQPSIYGSDNALLLKALRVQPGRHRGVVVIDSSIGEAELDAMHAAGVRGARLNLVSPVGESQADLAARFTALAPRLRERGWHLQWYAAPEHLPQIAQWHGSSAAHGVPCVLDHLGGMHAGVSETHPAWNALRELAAGGAWVKLSGWYRLQASAPCIAPYTALLPTVQRMAGLFGKRLVWGSDWPHTAFAPDALPAYASTWQPVSDALGHAAAQHLRLAASALN